MSWRTRAGILPAMLIFGLLVAAAVPGAAESPRESLILAVFPAPGQTIRVSSLLQERYSTLSVPVADRARRFGERYDAFRSLLPAPGSISGVAESPGTVAVYQKRLAIEHAISALTDTAGIEDAARAYAARARVYPDWRAGSTPPLAEAAYAASFLDDPLLRPYLLLFLLHRYRCAFESMVKEEDIVPIKEYRAKYRETLELARAHPDPLIGFLAGELDALPGNLNEPERFTGGPVHP